MAYFIEQERPRQEEKIVYFVRSGRQKELLQKFDSLPQLFGSDISYDGGGNIFYLTFRDLKRAKAFSSEYLLVSQLDQRVDFSAPYSRYQRFKEMRVHQVSDSVETAIRSVEHVLEEERGKEMFQVRSLGQRVSQLLDLFSTNFAEITPEQFEEEQRKTFELLTILDFDPAAVVNEEKKKMADWLVKASFGQDILGRRNKLISIMALQAAYRRGLERKRGIGGEIMGKFVRMREALIFEREFSRAIFEEVVYRLRPEAMPAHRLFKYPENPPDNLGIVRGILGTMRFQLRQPRVKTYRTVGLEIEDILAEITDLLLKDQRKEIVESGLFSQAYNLLTSELVRRQDIYPQKS